jgi:hypothetical protein
MICPICNEENSHAPNCPQDVEELEEMDLNWICQRAASEMAWNGIERHTSFVTADEAMCEPRKGKIVKVTIEWVDEAEAQPERHKAKTGA